MSLLFPGSAGEDSTGDNSPDQQTQSNKHNKCKQTNSSSPFKENPFYIGPVENENEIEIVKEEVALKRATPPASPHSHSHSHSNNKHQELVDPLLIVQNGAKQQSLPSLVPNSSPVKTLRTEIWKTLKVPQNKPDLDKTFEDFSSFEDSSEEEVEEEQSEEQEGLYNQLHPAKDELGQEYLYPLQDVEEYSEAFVHCERCNIVLDSETWKKDQSGKLCDICFYPGECKSCKKWPKYSRYDRELELCNECKWNKLCKPADVVLEAKVVQNWLQEEAKKNKLKLVLSKRKADRFARRQKEEEARRLQEPFSGDEDDDEEALLQHYNPDTDDIDEDMMRKGISLIRLPNGKVAAKRVRTQEVDSTAPMEKVRKVDIMTTTAEQVQPTAHLCGLCKNLFNSGEVFDLHLYRVHFTKEVTAMSADASPFKCKEGQCGATFQDRHSLILHLVKHHNVARPLHDQQANLAAAVPPAVIQQQQQFARLVRAVPQGSAVRASVLPASSLRMNGSNTTIQLINSQGQNVVHNISQLSQINHVILQHQQPQTQQQLQLQQQQQQQQQQSQVQIVVPPAAAARIPTTTGNLLQQVNTPSQALGNSRFLVVALDKNPATTPSPTSPTPLRPPLLPTSITSTLPASTSIRPAIAPKPTSLLRQFRKQTPLTIPKTEFVCPRCGFLSMHIDPKEATLNMVHHFYSMHFHLEIAQHYKLDTSLTTKCKVCPKRFVNKTELLKHMSVKHRGVVKWLELFLKKTNTYEANKEQLKQYSVENEGEEETAQEIKPGFILVTRPDESDRNLYMKDLGKAKSSNAYPDKSLTPPATPMPALNEANQKAYEHVQQTEMKKWRNGAMRGRSLVQKHPCLHTDAALPQCTECVAMNEEEKEDELQHFVCLFRGFRKIRSSGDGTIFMEAGFLNPRKDPTKFDKALWLPNMEYAKGLSGDNARFILNHVGPQFLQMVAEEEAEKASYTQRTDRTVVWKRVLKGVRESCDVCQTSLFNNHYCCAACGVLICLDCFMCRVGNEKKKAKKDLRSKHRSLRAVQQQDRDQYLWPLCHYDKVHKIGNLLLTQIVCGSSLTTLAGMVKEMMTGPAAMIELKSEQTLVLESAKILKMDIQDEEDDDDGVVFEKKVYNVEEDLLDTTLSPFGPRCPLCPERFQDSALALVHLTGHVHDQIASDLDAAWPNHARCDSCHILSASRQDVVLHVGTAHNETERLVRKLVAERQAQAGRSVTLIVDSEDSCRICSLDFEDNLMMNGVGERRTHLLTHARDWLAAEALPNPDGSFNCCKCGLVQKSRSTYTLHLATTHKMLDTFYTKDEEIENRDGNKMVSYPVKKKVIKIKEEKIKAKLMRTCPICNEYQGNTQNLARHQACNHYAEELSPFITRKSLTAVCDFCKYETERGPNLIMSHMTGNGVHKPGHEQVFEIMNNEDTLMEKRLEWMDSEEVETPPANSFKCLACKAEVTPHTSAINHLATHFAMDMHRKKDETKCEHCDKALDKGSYLGHLARTHLHQLREEFLLRTLPKNEDHRARLEPLLEAILKDRWCFLCEQDVSEGNHSHGLREHHLAHFRIILDRFMVGRVDCETCDMKFGSKEEYAMHFAKLHLYSKVEEMLLGLYGEYTQLVKLRWFIGINKGSSVDCWSVTDYASSYCSTRRGSIADSEDEMMAEQPPPSCEYCPETVSEGRMVEHLSLVHFKAAMEKDVLQIGESSFKCPRCIFVDERKDNVILHLAEYHEQLKRIMNHGRVLEQKEKEGKDNNDASCGFAGLTELCNGLMLVQGETELRTCVACGASASKQVTIERHVLGHVTEVVRKRLPTGEPCICPVCSYESASGTSLRRHYIKHHVGDLRSKLEALTERNLTWTAAVKSKKPREEIQEPEMTQILIKVENVKEAVGPEAPLTEAELEQKRKDATGLWDRAVQIGEEPLKLEEFEEDEIQVPSSAQDWLKMINPQKEKTESRHPHIVLPSETALVSNNAEWLCDGRLLLLHDFKSTQALALFQAQWLRGQPVLLAASSAHLDMNLWSPAAFKRDYGKFRHSLVNCLNGSVVPNAPLDKFWAGFEYLEERLKTEKGRPMLLKLKDWPPSEDIADFMPDRFNDLVNAFPMPDYTLRDGKLNLASFLPDYFLRPELGPKMYIAYGSALYPDKGSTNLHIDMSDAVNVLVWASTPKDGNDQDNKMEIWKEIDNADCDRLTKERARRPGERPGALWHIFHPKHTPSIRDLLKKIAMEKGKRLDPYDDPIHDQSSYLDENLRIRLYREYGVQGYAIVQHQGDTVFIPAGAAHQVRNLANCIKVAEDFVSPENVAHCLHLTQEFRRLSDFHTNHEDKLQIKSIIYHSVKSAVAVLDAERKNGIEID